MFEHEVLVISNAHNVRLLKKMGLKLGRDFRSVNGAVAKGRPGHLLLKFNDLNVALMFKLRARA